MYAEAVEAERRRKLIEKMNSLYVDSHVDNWVKQVKQVRIQLY